MPEIFILLFAMFREIVCQGHFPDFNDIVSHLPIFLPIAFAKTSEFISGHVSGKLSLP